MADDDSPSLPSPPGFRWDGPLLVPDPADALTMQLPDGLDLDGDADSIAELKAQETCPICRQLLDAIGELDEPTRSAALVEYGRFKAAMEGEQATEEDIKRVFEENPTLEHVLIDKIGIEGLGMQIEE